MFKPFLKMFDVLVFVSASTLSSGLLNVQMFYCTNIQIIQYINISFYFVIHRSKILK